MNIESNFIPHEVVICDNRDPPWINARTRNVISNSKILCKKYLCSNKNTKVFEEFKLPQNKIVNLMINSRDRYYTRISNKLTDSHVFPKAFWSILKILLNSENL